MAAMRALTLTFATGLVLTAVLSLSRISGQNDDAQRLAKLEVGVERAEAIRAVKRLQQTYNHYLDVGLWDEMDALVSANSASDFPAPGQPTGEKLNKGALRERWMKLAGRTTQGLADGQINTHLLMQPIVNLGPDGKTAKGTWHELAMLGQAGKSAEWVGGIYENEYALENSAWRITKVHFSEQYRGLYEEPGQKAPPKWEVPYHFTAEHVGLTIPPTALQPGPSTKEAPAAKIAKLTSRLQKMEDESAVQNLQNIYSYYLDRKMFDDIADLFTSDGAFVLDEKQTRGKTEIRKLLATMYGEPKLKYGELRDHINLYTVATVAPDGKNAGARSTELRQIGLINDNQRWELGIYENKFVKEDGVWKIQVLAFFPRMTTPYEKGWAKEGLGAFHFPAFHYPNPVTGKQVKHPAGVWKSNMIPQTAAAKPAAKSISELEIMLAQAIGFDATENLNSAYGYYLDESAWDSVAEICATNCEFELSDVGVYIGRERARQSLKLRYPNNGRGPNSYTIHQLVQPVIHVSADGKTARGRFRLFQGGGSANGSSASWIGGIYENQAFFDNGEWKYGVKDLQHQFSARYKDGWAKIAPRATPAANTKAPAAPKAAPKGDGKAKGGGLAAFPPDRPQRTRQYPFPEIDEPAFHYKNPVSGRVPPIYLP
jgi:hypothetical protein